MTKFLSLCLGLFLLLGPLQAQMSDSPFELEALINQRLRAFPFQNDNLFRLAAYAEMKGDYSPRFKALSLHFGNLGMMNIYERSCLLRTPRGVWHLEIDYNSPTQIQAMNQELARTFDQIILLGNEDGNPDLIDFVDRHLAKKNIEPFDKIFLRHLLVRYGRFDKTNNRVVFHTDWLPDSTFSYRSPRDQTTIQKPINPLMVKLDEHVVRGYYIKAGGTVYVEDVEREVLYATGEEYKFNVSAFKVFIQKLFVQTTHYVVAREQERLNQMQSELAIRDVIRKQEVQKAYAVSDDASFVPRAQPQRMVSRGGASAAPRTPALKIKAVEPLYHKYNWIPMMLGILRQKGISVADPEIAHFLIGKPYFQRIYDQLTVQEKAGIDRIIKKQ
jgi:hypothetical protein